MLQIYQPDASEPGNSDMLSQSSGFEGATLYQLTQRAYFITKVNKVACWSQAVGTSLFMKDSSHRAKQTGTVLKMQIMSAKRAC